MPSVALDLVIAWPHDEHCPCTFKTDTYSETPFHPLFSSHRLWQHFQAEQ